MVYTHSVVVSLYALYSRCTQVLLCAEEFCLCVFAGGTIILVIPMV